MPLFTNLCMGVFQTFFSRLLSPTFPFPIVSKYLNHRLWFPVHFQGRTSNSEARIASPALSSVSHHG
jgi:hypothetical protein